MDPNTQYVTQLRPADVLLGRGSGPNDHEGNIIFRQMVAERKAEYMATNHRLTKAKIAQEIIDAVYQNNGRFLRKIEAKEATEFGIPDGVDAWLPASEETITEKAKQALRQNPNKGKGAGVDDSSSPGKSPVKTTQQRATDAAAVVAAVAANVNQFEAPNASRVQTTVTAGLSRDVGVVGAPGGYQDDFDPIPISTYNRGGASSLPNRQPEQNKAPSIMGPPRPVNMQLHGQPQQQPPQQQQWGPRDTAGGLPAVEQSVGLGQQQPQAVRYTQQQQFVAQSGGGVLGNDQSMAQIPIDDTPIGMENRRGGSMTMSDLAKWHSRRHRQNGAGEQPSDPNDSSKLLRDHMQSSDDAMVMSGLMDSFNKMKTGDGGAAGAGIPSAAEQRKMYASTETMGTIEPIGVSSIADMSFATMNSSTFSIFKGNEMFGGSDDKLGVAHTGERGDYPAETAVPATQTSSEITGNENPAMYPPQSIQMPASGAVGQNIQQQPTSSLSNANSSAARFRQQQQQGPVGAIYEHSEYEPRPGETVGAPGDLGQQNGPAPHHPRPVALMEDHPDDLHLGNMGTSSMSILKAAFVSSVDFDASRDMGVSRDLTGAVGGQQQQQRGADASRLNDRQGNQAGL